MPEKSHKDTCISRRKLMGATGASLLGCAVAPNLLAQTAKVPVQRIQARSPIDWLPKPVERGGDAAALAGAPTGGQHRLTGFINLEEGLKVAKLNKKMGWSVQIKPTGYRGIPLYTVSSIKVTVDGKAVDPNGIVFVYNNTAYSIDRLKELQGMQWWVFDWATLFIPGTLSTGEHEIDVRMAYANTYGMGTATNGAAAKLVLNTANIDYLCL